MRTIILLLAWLSLSASTFSQNLIAYYPFNGNANDQTTNAINPTYVGSGVTLTTDRFGNANKAYNFDGLTGSYMRMPADLLPTTNRTVSMWFNVPDVTNRPGLLGYGGNGSYGTTLLMGLNCTGTGQYWVQGHGGLNGVGYTYPAAPVNNWYHWVLTINGSTQKIYVNGELKTTANTFSGSTAVAGKDFALGVITSASGVAPYTDVNVGYLNGKLDDIRIYDNAMTDAQVQNLYVNEAMVAYFPFNGNATDETGNGNNSTYIGTGVTLTTDRFGNANKAYHFDGAVGSYIRVPADKFPTTDRTISFWFNAERLDYYLPTPFSYGGNVCNDNFITVLNHYSWPNKYTVLAHCATNRISASYVTEPINNWYHFTATISGTTQKIYINGVLQQTDNTFITPTYITGTSALMGAMVNTDGNSVFAGYFQGKLDEFRIYNSAMADAQILQLYNNESTGLVASYPFNGNANDASGFGRHGTATNGATLTTDRFGNANSAYDFDGINDYIDISATGLPETNRTVMFWLNPATGNQPSFPVTYGGNGCGTSYLMGFNVSNANLYNTQGHCNTNALSTAPWSVNPENQWTHFAVTISGTTIKIFINGVESVSNNVFALPTFVDGRKLFIGALITPDGLSTYIDGSGGYFKGKLDDIKIYNTALSNAQVASEYSGMVAYYPFNGNANDESGNGNNGTVNGATLTTDRFGNVNKAYNFTNPNHISVPNSNMLGDEFTVSYWFKLISYFGQRAVMSNVAVPNGGFQQAFDGTTFSYILGYNFPQTNDPLFSNYTMQEPLSQWHHVAVTYKKTGTNLSESKLFINGELKKSSNHIGLSILFTPNATFYIGQNHSGLNFEGSLDDIRIYNRNLSPNEILQLADVPMMPDLVVYLPMNGNANDMSGNGYNGTVSGAVLTQDKYGSNNSAYEFPGTGNQIVLSNSTGLGFQNSGFTLSAWVKYNNAYGHIIAKHTCYSGTGYVLEILNNQFTFLLDNSGTWTSVATNETFTNGKWYHVAAIYNGAGVASIYINGELKVSGPVGYNSTNTASVVISGASGSCPQINYHGSIDEVKIYSAALDAAQVMALYKESRGSGNAVNFDGVDDHIVTNEYLVPTTGDFTVELWVYNRNINGYREFISQGWGPNAFYIGTSNLTGYIRLGDTWGTTVELPQNKWVHLAVVKSGSNGVLYMDGIQVATSTSYSIGAGGTQTQIGKQYGPHLEYADAFLDEIRIWNTAFSAEGVRDWMNRKITPDHPSFSYLVSYYNFDEKNVLRTYETKGAKTGVLVNGPQFVTSGAPIGDASVHNIAASSVPATLTLPTGENFSALQGAGTALGLYVYVVNDPPEIQTGILGLGSNDHYFGVKKAEMPTGTTASYTATYNYTGNPFVSPAIEPTLQLFKRNNNSDTLWINSGATLNMGANTLTVTGQNTEYILGTGGTSTVPDAIAIPASQATCSGSAITPIVITGNVPSTVFNWTRDNTSAVTGIAASGTGDISGTLTNTTNAPVLVTFTITPTAGGNTGLPITATVTVNPTPDVVATPATQAICSGSAITTILLSSSVSGGSCGNLFFSEYLEGASNNKAIEIYNPTASPINLSDYKIYRYNNGSPVQQDSLQIPGTLAPGAVYVAGNPSADPAILAVSDTLHTITFFNGDDVLSLFHIPTNSLVDIIGVIGVDPGINWPVGAGATSEFTLVRKISVNQGTTNWALAATEYDVYPQNTTTFLGSHTMSACGATFSWTRDNTVTVTGIAASGTGNISGSLTNTSNVPVSVHFTITSTANGCLGTPITATVLVNPLPEVTQPLNQIICNNSATAPINFTGSGTIFNWVNNNTSIGLAASGTGNIPSFTATNATASPVTATVTVTPSTGSNFAYITNRSSNNVSVVNTASNVVVATIAVESMPIGVSVIPDGSKVYITNYISNTVSVINTATNTVMATIPVGTNPYGLSVSPDGSRVYVANISSNNVSVINTTTDLVISTIAAGTAPAATKLSPDGSRLYIVNNSSNDVSVINVATNSLVATVPVGLVPFGISVSPDGSKVYIANQNSNTISVINTATNLVDATFTVGTAPVGTAVAADGSRLYVTNQSTNNMSVINTANNSTVATVTVGANPFGISISADGSRIYVANYNSNDVSVINPVTNTVVATVPAGTNPNAFGNFITGNPVCTGTPKIFTITVNPKPDITQPANQAVCNNTATAAINFAGSVAGTSFNWTNNNATIGLAVSGTGNIPSFTATNATTSPVTATVTVTPFSGGSFAYMTNEGSNSVSVISTVSNTVLTNIGVGSQPWGECLSADGSRLYVVNRSSGNISVINTATQTNIGTISVSSDIWGIAINPEGSRLYVAKRAAGQVLVVNTTTNAIIATISVESGALCTAVSSDGNRVYVSNNNTNTVSVINAVTNTVVATIIVGSSPAGISVSPDGNYVYVANQNTNTISVINTITNTVQATITAGTTPSGTTISPDGSRLYVTSNGTNTVLVINTTTNAVITSIPVGANPSGISFSPDGSRVYVANWQAGNVSVINAATNTVITNIPVGSNPVGFGNFVSGNPVCTGVSKTFTITVNPTATVTTVPNQVLCNGAVISAINFSSPTTGGTIVYNWTNNTTSIGLAASGSGNIASFTATNTTNASVTATITVTPTYTNGGTSCAGSPSTFTITINPTATVTAVANQVVCNGAATTAINFTSPTTGGTIVYNWTNNTASIGLASSGTGNIGSFTAINTTNAPVTATISVTPTYTNAGVSCAGTPSTFTITVNPTATVTTVSNQVVCNGAATTAINFTSPATGGTIVYNWTNNTTSIGLASSGSGNIASFTATNTTNAPVTATITVTPTYTNAGVSCAGSPSTFTITVNPTATVTTVSNQVVCNGAITTAVNFTSPATGGTIVYNWTNNTTSVGLAASGIGNIASFTATNTTNAPLTATITVTATYTIGGTSCVGTPTTFTIIVNPTATVTTVSNQVVCNGTATIAVNFTSPTSGGTIVYNWINNTTGIGLGASGSGNIGSFTAINTTNAPVTATITVTPAYTNAGVSCSGTPSTFTITINPTPNVVSVPASQFICSGSPIITIVSSGNIPGTVFNWTRDNTATVTGIAASGTGNVSGTLINNTISPITVTFTITPTYTNGGVTCSGPSATASVIVNPQPVASISYTGSPYCTTVTSAPVTLIGTTGGSYSSSPAGLAINATTGTVSPNTSTPGTYTVTYTLAGCAAFTATASVTITAAPNVIILYAGSPYCSNAGTANVSRFGTPGGTYSAAPAGLTINATTGAVTLGTSTPGTYTVTYSVTVPGCGITNTTTPITITAAPNATIAYAGSPYCSNTGTANVTLTGSPAGGVYSSSAGLSINATTGAVNLAASTAGTYTVTYTVAAGGGCALYTTTTTITITALPAATIAYAGSPYCSNAGTAAVTRTGTAGGTYTAVPAGLSINAATGDVNLAASTAGTYTVTYTIATGGGCPAVTATASITITTVPAATISYAGNPFCQPGGIATVTRTGTAGGTYSAAPAGLSINAATGDINITTSTPGTYTVTYALAAGSGCPVVNATTTVTVNSLSVAPTAANANVPALCGSGTVTLSVVGGSLGSGATWRWYSGSCGGTAVGTGATLNVTVNTTTTYFVRAEGACNTTACVSVTVTVNTQPAISIAAAPGTILKPFTTTTLTATVIPSTGNTIVWYRNGNVVPGATGTILQVTIDGLGQYAARVTTGAGCTALSNAVNITSEETSQLFITPNPNEGQFKVRYYTSATELGFVRHLVMFAGNGQKVFDQIYPITAPYSSMDVDARRLSKGMYVVMLTDAFGNEVLATGQVVIQ